jgi:hypothetical protein
METEEKEVSYHMTDHLNEMINVVNAAEVDEILKAVKSLISDIESMRCKVNASMLDNDEDPDHWFGAFSTYITEFEGSDDYGVAINWPNLAISLSTLKKLLEPQTIEGELSFESRVKRLHETLPRPTLTGDDIIAMRDEQERYILGEDEDE